MTIRLKVSAAIALVLCAADGLSAASVLAESQEDRQACIGDAFKYCAAAIPDRNGVFICLIDHRNVLSAGCRIAIAPHASVDQTSSKEDGSYQAFPNK